jgi:hypothetical protein
MKLEDFDIQTYDLKEADISEVDLERFFEVYLKPDNRYAFNLNETIYISQDNNSVKEYITNKDSHWPIISYNIYKTTRYAWILMKLNQIPAEYMFTIVPAGTRVKYLDDNFISNIISYLN